MFSPISFAKTATNLLTIEETFPLTVKATQEEFLSLMVETEFKIEYYNGKIYCWGIVSDKKDALIVQTSYLLSTHFTAETEYKCYAGKRPIHVQNDIILFPDMQISKGEIELIDYPNNTNGHLNPWLIMEVVSNDSQQYDWDKKLPAYKKIDSVKYIIYVKQESPHISVFERSEPNNVWLNSDFDNLEQSFTIEGKQLPLKDIYRKILR